MPPAEPTKNEEPTTDHVGVPTAERGTAAKRLLPTPNFLLSAFCFLLSAFCFLLSAFCFWRLALGAWRLADGRVAANKEPRTMNQELPQMNQELLQMIKFGRLLAMTMLIAHSLLGPLNQLRAEEPGKQKSSTHDLIRHLLDQDLGTRTFPFPDVVRASCGKNVIPVDLENPAHQLILDAIAAAADHAITALSSSSSPNSPSSPLRKLRRINEASHFFENHLRQQIHAQDSLSCTIPTNSKGNQQRTGYPDLIISHTASDGTITHAYLDPKLFEQKSQASSLRTFYFEPRTHTNKIQHHAMHLLLGISHDGNDGDWTFTSWKLCDLSKFNVRLRAEFQSSNRDIYRPHIIIRTSDTAPAR